jgi:hypothetical protein
MKRGIILLNTEISQSPASCKQPLPLVYSQHGGESQARKPKVTRDAQVPSYEQVKAHRENGVGPEEARELALRLKVSRNEEMPGILPFEEGMPHWWIMINITALLENTPKLESLYAADLSSCPPHLLKFTGPIQAIDSCSTARLTPGGEPMLC